MPVVYTRRGHASIILASLDELAFDDEIIRIDGGKADRATERELASLRKQARDLGAHREVITSAENAARMRARMECRNTD